MTTTALIALNAIILAELMKMEGIIDSENENMGEDDIINLLLDFDGYLAWITSGTTYTEREVEYLEVEVFHQDWPEDAEKKEFVIAGREDVKQITSYIETEIRKLKAEE